MVLNYTYLRYTSAGFYGDFDSEIQKEHQRLGKDRDANIFKVNFSFGYEIKYFKLALNVTAVKQKNSPFSSATKGYYGLGTSINIDEFFKKKKSKK